MHTNRTPLSIALGGMLPPLGCAGYGGMVQGGPTALTSTSRDSDNVQHEGIEFLLGRIARIGRGIGGYCGDRGQRAGFHRAAGQSVVQRGGSPIRPWVGLGHLPQVIPVVSKTGALGRNREG